MARLRCSRAAGQRMTSGTSEALGYQLSQAQPVVSQLFPMIGGEDHQRVVGLAVGLDGPVQQPPELVVDLRNHRGVGGAPTGVAPVIGLGQLRDW